MRLNTLLGRHWPSCLLAITLLLGCSAAIAQTFVASVVGLVTDSSGAVVPETQVTLTEVDTGVVRKVFTNSSGNYTFSGLTPGVYTLNASQKGFGPVDSGNITLQPSQVARWDVVLRVGDVQQKVDVAAQATTLNTENAQLGATVTRDEILNLPLNDRSAMNYRYLSSSNQDGGYLAGQRSSFGFYSIDGVTAMTPAWGGWSGPQASGMSMEALQDITQVTATPSAEFGDVATVSLSTRSGTNDFHGAGFWETNNYALDSADYFSHTKPKGPYRQYFGGSIGGPVRLPHIYNGKNRTFFFFVWEEFLQPGSYNSLASVPTQAMRNGDFSPLLAQGVTIFDPASGHPFSGNVIPTSRISSVSQRIQDTKYIPLPNFGPAGSLIQNYLDTFPNAHGHYYPTARLDHNFRDGKDTITARYTFRHQNEDTNENGLPLYNRIQNRETTNGYISETHLFSPTIVNEFRAGYSRDFSSFHGTTIGSNVLSDWGLQLPHADALQGLYGVPQVNFENFTGLTEYSNTGWAQDTMEYLDNVSISRGKHTTKVGFSIRRYKVNEVVGDTQGNFGVMDFRAFGTQDAHSNGGYDYASFLLGIPYDTQTHDRSPNAVARYGTYAGYVQDDWRITPKLTLNFGLRWEKTTMPVDQSDMRFTFDPATGNLVVPTQKVIDTLVSPVFPKNIPIVTAAKAGFPSRSLVNSDQNWGPRFGFAHQLPWKMTVRGGFGLFFTPLVTGAVINNFNGGPFQLEQSFQNRLVNGAPAFQMPNPFSLIGQGNFPGVTIGSLEKKVRTPYTEQFNFTVEKQIDSSMVARASYRGHHTIETIYYPDLNQPFVSDNPDNEQHLVYPNFYNVQLGRNGGSEIGHLFEFQLQRKYGNGLTFDLGYTHTKVVTDLRGSDITGQPEYSWDLRRDTGNENGLSRHRFVGTALWDLPFGNGKRFGSNLPGWAKQVIGNWQTSYILALQSGQFLDPGCGDCPDTSNARVFGGRPNLVGDPKLSNANANLWFNPQAFAQPAPGTLGNSSPGVIVGPGLVNVDFGLMKYFKIREKVSLKLKMSAMNFFNHPNLGNPNTNISSTNVGTITGLSGRGVQQGYSQNDHLRAIMLGARIEF